MAPPRLPHNASRAFETTGRLGSMSAAAGELGVTHGAVSRQIQALEARFGVPLLRRLPMAVEPTPAGAQLAANLGQGARSPGLTVPTHLVLRLKALIASFGAVSGEELRRAGEAPTRSMVLGLIGHAMGLDRTRSTDMARLDRLQARTRFAALILADAGTWSDVQNARVGAARFHDTAARLVRGGRITDDPAHLPAGNRSPADDSTVSSSCRTTAAFSAATMPRSAASRTICARVRTRTSRVAW